MLSAVSFVLLVAAANVATLLLVRVGARTTASAVKTAMGAPRSALVQEVLGEVAPIALGGGVLGLWLSREAIRSFNAAVGDTIPAFWMRVALDWEVALFAGGAAVMAALLAGVVPAVRAAGVDPANALRSPGRGPTRQSIGRVMRAFVVAELALSTLALVTAALMAKGVLVEARSRLRFDPGGIVATRIDAATLPASSIAPATALPSIRARIAEDPRIGAAATTDVLPGIRAPQRPFAIAGRTYPRDADLPAAGLSIVSDGFFELMRLSPVRGRVFVAGDDATRDRVAIVTTDFVAAHLAGSDPLGARVRLADWPPDSAATIVGVVPAPGTLNRAAGAGVMLFLPAAQHPSPSGALLVRSRGSAVTAMEAVRAAIVATSPDLGIQRIATLEDELREARRAGRAIASVFAASGVAGLLLAMLGVYGVVAARVRDPRRELGIRSALGASPARLALAVVAAGGIDLVIALALGLGVGAAFTPTLEGVLFGVDPHDGQVFAAVAAALALGTLAGIARPALAAGRTSPAIALNE
jgi:putative ABC transport system permease protein